VFGVDLPWFIARYPTVAALRKAWRKAKAGTAQMEVVWGRRRVDLEEKRKAIESNPPPVKPSRGRWRRPEVLEFLASL
jgi:hypothetical protein